MEEHPYLLKTQSTPGRPPTRPSSLESLSPRLRSERNRAVEATVAAKVSTIFSLKRSNTVRHPDTPLERRKSADLFTVVLVAKF
jgi:hypothetical protein